MLKGLALAALIAMSATAAHAGGGPRIEAHLGFDQQAIETVITDDTVSYNAMDFKSDGFLYGGEAGYDLAFGKVQLGVYGGLDLANTGECTSYGAGNQLCIEAGRSYYAGVRVGYALSDGVLVYAKGGYSNGRVTTRYHDAAVPANNGSVNDDFSGYHVGGGIQVDLSRALYAKAEFLHTDYEDYVARSGTTGVHTSLDRDMFVYGMGLRF